jgi:hypothetical protein
MDIEKRVASADTRARRRLEPIEMRGYRNSLLVGAGLYGLGTLVDSFELADVPHDTLFYVTALITVIGMLRTFLVIRNSHKVQMEISARATLNQISSEY